MNKAVGYLLAIAGLVFIILSFTKFTLPLGFLPDLSTKGMILMGIAFVTAGVLAIKMFGDKSGNASQQSEVPIYEGDGKKRKVVGYKRQ